MTRKDGNGPTNGNGKGKISFTVYKNTLVAGRPTRGFSRKESSKDDLLKEVEKFLEEGFEVSLEIDPKGQIGKKLAKLDGVTITDPKLQRVDSSKPLDAFTDR